MDIIDPITIKDTVLTSSSVAEADFAAWIASTTYAVGDKVVEISPTATVTISAASPCVVTWTGHGRAANTPVVFTTSGALPAGLTAGIEYYVRALTVDTFGLALTSGGAAINTSGSQSGTHTATARVHKIYESLVGSRSTVTMTIATPCVVSWTAHGYADGAPISFTTTGALATGLVAGTVYYVKSPGTDTFNVAATSGGTAIATSGSQSGTHTATATPAESFNKQPAINTSQWLDDGATNRWRMFDASNASQTENANSIVVTFNAVDIATGFYLGGLDADSVTLTVTDAIEGLVYTETQSLVLSTSGSSFFGWFFGKIAKKTAIASKSLPPYANATIVITITRTGDIARCGMCVIGRVVDGGSSLVGLGTDIKDYSTVIFNADGSSGGTPRGYSKRMTVDVLLSNDVIDTLQNLLSTYRQKNVVWIGNINYESTMLFGKFSSFKNVIGGITDSKMSLQIEGVV
jgi:hypothetical protein